jgi:hypothetical protein
MKNPPWERLPAELRSLVDELTADDNKPQAIVAIRSMLDEPRPGVFECRQLLAERYAELEEPWFSPSQPLDLDGLTEQIAALPHPPDAIEAVGMATAMAGSSVCSRDAATEVRAQPRLYQTRHRHAKFQRRSPAMTRSARSDRHRPRPRRPDRRAVPLRKPGHPHIDLPRWWTGKA